jgi:hypothetical protein
MAELVADWRHCLDERWIEVKRIVNNSRSQSEAQELLIAMHTGVV